MGAELAGSKTRLRQLRESAKTMCMAPTQSGSGLPAVQGVQAQVPGGGQWGVPQSMKWVKLAPLDKAGPSKGPLFIESEPEEELASETSETSPAGLEELEGVIQAQTTALQDQLATQEWLASRLERVAVVLDGHRTAMEELLAALTSVGQRFGAGLGLGLDAQSKALLCGEWGGIRVTREEVSENEQ